jgi:hypothetical protein
MIMITLRANRTGRNILGSQANYPPSTQLGWPKTFVLSNIQGWNQIFPARCFLLQDMSIDGKK